MATFLTLYISFSLAVSITMTTTTARAMFEEEKDFTSKERTMSVFIIFFIHVLLWPVFLGHIIWTLLKK